MHADLLDHQLLQLRLLHRHKQVAAALERDQARFRDVPSCELSVVEQLQPVVLRVQGQSADTATVHQEHRDGGAVLAAFDEFNVAGRRSDDLASRADAIVGVAHVALIRKRDQPSADDVRLNLLFVT